MSKPVKIIRKHPKIKPEMVEAHTWYCLCVAPQCEFKVQDIMQMFGYLTYVPVRKEYRFKTKVNKAKKKKEIISYPLMNGYVFVGFHPNQLHTGNIPYWSTIFDQPIIMGAVGTLGEPKEINKASLQRFTKQHPNGLQRPKHEAFMRTHAEFDVGDFVTVCDGPFTGLNVPVMELSSDKAQAKVSVEMFGGAREIVIDTFDLEKAA